MNQYFKKVFKKYGTEFWSNNPSGTELEVALKLGAVCVATNPCYTSSLLPTERKYIDSVVEKLKNSYDFDDDIFPVKIHEEILSRPLNLFYPIYKKTNGQYGLVAIQGDPRKNDDADFILKEAERLHKLGENIIIKVPATIEGAMAMEELTIRGWPTIGTMGFSVSQYIYMAEAYHRGLKRSKSKPRCLITMIVGVFDEYLNRYIDENNINISKDLIRYAGVSAARAAYKIFLKNKYIPIILAGAMKKPYHWTELVGKNFGMTVGGSLALEIIKENIPVESKIDSSYQQGILDELTEKLPDFKKACEPDALKPKDFRTFGPAKMFQENFLSCYEKVTSYIKEYV